MCVQLVDMWFGVGSAQILNEIILEDPAVMVGGIELPDWIQRLSPGYTRTDAVSQDCEFHRTEVWFGLAIGFASHFNSSVCFLFAAMVGSGNFPNPPIGLALCRLRMVRSD